MQPQQPSAADVPPVVELRAVAYSRNSAQDEQENSIPLQRNQGRRPSAGIPRLRKQIHAGRWSGSLQGEIPPQRPFLRAQSLG